MISRRNVLKLAAVLLCSGGLAVCLRDSHAVAEDATIAFLEGLPDTAEIRQVGRAYLSQHPDENDLGGLEASVWRELPDIRPWHSQRTVHTFIAEAVTRDYAAGRTETIQGWVLSRTELRLCALSALLERS